MSYTYIGAISEGFPNVQVSSTHAETYESLRWVGGDPMPTKAELDAWIANQTAAESVINANKVVQVLDGVIPQMQGTSRITPDNNAPTNTSGFLLWENSYTPSSVNSRILINYTFTADHSSGSRIITTTLWAGSVCIGVMSTYVSSSNRPAAMTLTASYTPTSTVPVIISARVGANGSGTTYVNRTAGATYGGGMTTSYIITETLAL